jgi:hypothetical protein
VLPKWHLALSTARLALGMLGALVISLAREASSRLEPLARSGAAAAAR